ncbi:hypothetical protein RhiirA5_384417, partial [Rhizophagus irregularis]
MVEIEYFQRQKYKRNGGTTSNLHRHLQNKHPLVVTKEINNKDKNMGSLDEFANVTPIFSRATEHISHGKFPTLENSVPIYNWLMDEIEKFQDDANIKIEVKNAALKAMEKLKKYYKDTDALPYTVTT